MRIDSYARPITDANIADIKEELTQAIIDTCTEIKLKKQTLEALKPISHHKTVNANASNRIEDNAEAVSTARLRDEYGNDRTLTVYNHPVAYKHISWHVRFQKRSSVADLIAAIEADTYSETMLARLQNQLSCVDLLVEGELNLRAIMREFEAARSKLNQAVLGNDNGYYHESVRKYLTYLTAN